MIQLTEALCFPPVDQADENGLLAMGGDLSPERLLLSYKSGIFPWFSEDEPILWWSPDPRFVLIPQHLQISKSMQSVFKKQTFSFSTNQAFEQVIQACSAVPRAGQDGTWITDDVVNAYTKLHQMGHAHSAEAWFEGELVGGLYGIKMGRLFFGESMFSTKSNASKFAFIAYVQQLLQEDIVLIDCQVYTEHLESLGAVMMHRKDFISVVQQFC